MKKQTQTFHPLQVAKSLEAQNEAINLLITKARTLGVVRKNVDLPDTINDLLDDIEAEADHCASLMWPTT